MDSMGKLKKQQTLIAEGEPESTQKAEDPTNPYNGPQASKNLRRVLTRYLTKKWQADGVEGAPMMVFDEATMPLVNVVIRCGMKCLNSSSTSSARRSTHSLRANSLST